MWQNEKTKAPEYIIPNSFKSHPLIKHLATLPYWTYSYNKIPIDFHAFTIHKQIQGCSLKVHGSSTTLKELFKYNPTTSSAQFYFDTNRIEHKFGKKYIVIDIEPTCDEKLKKLFLHTPFVYGESSMSGKGVHLIVELPKEFENLKNLQNRTSLKYKKQFEIFFEHWITFTGQNIIKSSIKSNTNLVKILEFLDKQYTKKVDISNIDTQNGIDLETIKGAKKLANHLIKRKPFYKTLEDDYAGDESKYEYNLIFYKLIHLLDSLELDSFKKELGDYKLNYSEIATILTYAVRNILPIREKHNTLRGGKDYLSYLVMKTISWYVSSDTGKNDNRINHVA